MVSKLNEWIGWFNQCGDGFCRFAACLFLQVAILVAVLICLDLLLKRKARAIVRYWLWTLVLAKLVLPVQFGTPVSLGYWIAPKDSIALGDEQIIPRVVFARAAMVKDDAADPTADFGRQRAKPVAPIASDATSSDPDLVASNSPVVVPEATPKLESLHWKALALAAWLIGVTLLMGIVIRRALLVRQIVDDASDAPEKFQASVKECLAVLGMKELPVRIRISERLGSPAICGFWRPTILLPHGLTDRLDSDQLRLVITHELAHWKRFDLQLNSLQTVLQAFYFYNPAVWFANAVIRCLREQAVDETVLVSTRSGVQSYGNTLLDIAATDLRPAELTLRLIGVVESRRLLAGRIQRIVESPLPKTAKLGFAGLLLIIVVGIVLLPMAGKPSLAAPQNATAAADSVDKAQPVDDAQSKQVANPAATAATEPNLHGRLVDETGEPVTDAEIELTFSRTYRTVKTKSDKDGNYQFSHINDLGEYQIAINSKRWVGITDRKELPRVDLNPQGKVVRDFVLQRACRLRVQTVDEQGQPVGGVSIYSSLTSDNQNFATNATTDKQGWATLGGLKPSPAERLVATMKDGYAFTRTILTLADPSAAVAPQIILLRKGQAVSGKALCSDGKPASGWHINAMPTWWHFGVSPMGQLIGDDGSFTLPHMLPDTYNVIVSIPESKQMSIAKTVLSAAALPSGDEPLSVTVDYPSPGTMATISGHIEFIGGALERGMHLNARTGGGKYTGDTFIQPGQQDFEIGPVPRGVYTIEFESTEIEPLTLHDVQIPSDKKLAVEVKVRGTLALRGIVVRAGNQQPVTQFRTQVTKVRTLSGPNYVQDSNWHEFKDDHGAFKIDVAGPGIYVVQVAADGLGLATSKPFNTEQDGPGPIRIELAAGTPLVGTVIDELGKPISGAKVFPLPNAAVMRGQTVGGLTPGEPVVETLDGRFTLPALPMGRGVIKVMHPDYAPAILDTNAAREETKTSTLSVVLHSGATVRGHVYGDDGKPEPNVELHFLDRSSEDEKLRRLATAISDQNGYYEVRHLPEQFCYVLRADPWTSWGVVRHAVWTMNGKTQTLDFGGPTKLTGRLIVNGSPLANARVQLSGENPNFGIFKAFARSDQDGAFMFWGTPPGQRTLYYTTSPQGSTWVRVKSFQVTQASDDLGAIECASGKLTVQFDSPADTAVEGLRLELQEFNPIWPVGNAVGKLLDRQNRSDPFVFDQVPPGKYELVCYRPNQFTIRQIVEMAPTSRQQTVTINLPRGTASLSGKLAATICPPDGGRTLKMWSADQRLLGTIIPKIDGTYRVDNIPTGEYTIKDKDTRDADTLLTVSLRDQENKTLDITSESISGPVKPIGFVVVYVFSAEGVPIPGCEIQFEEAMNPATLSSSQDGRMVFIGVPGIHGATVAYPGFKPVGQSLDFKPIDKDGKAKGTVEQRILLLPSDD